MRSIKSELYLFIKAILLGGIYTDSYPKEYDFKEKEFSIQDNGETVKINNYMFYNSLLNEYPFLSVLFRIEDVSPDLWYLRTSETSDLAAMKETVRFSLFIPFPKETANELEEDYLMHLDVCEGIERLISGKKFYGITSIIKVGETSDPESRVVMGKEIIFQTQAERSGESDLKDANDPVGTVTAEVGVVVVKKVT